MNNTRFTSFLIALLFIITVATVVISCWYFLSLRKLQSLQTEMVIINNQRGALQGFASEAFEYSKKNPAIDPLLQSMGIRIKGMTNTPKPATR